MTTTFMDRPSERIWCAIEGMEALSTDAAEAALMQFEEGDVEDVAEIEEDGADEQPDTIDETDTDADEGDDAEPADDEELDEDDPSESDAEDEPEEDNDEGDDEDSDEPATAIEAPQFWDAGGKEAFAKLPKEAQQAVVAYEQQRNAVVSRKLNEVATERKQLEQRVSGLDDFVSEVDRKLDAFKDVDWVTEGQLVEDGQLDPKIFNDARRRFDMLTEKKARVEEVKQKAEFAAFQDHVKTESARMQEVAQHLAGQAPEAVQKRTDIATYLHKQGVDQDALRWIGASEMALAEKAMLYDRAQAKAKAAPKPKPVGNQSKRKGLKPSAQTAPTSSKQAIRSKLAKGGSLSTDDAVSALLGLEI